MIGIRRTWTVRDLIFVERIVFRRCSRRCNFPSQVTTIRGRNGNLLIAIRIRTLQSRALDTSFYSRTPGTSTGIGTGTAIGIRCTRISKESFPLLHGEQDGNEQDRKGQKKEAFHLYRSRRFFVARRSRVCFFNLQISSEPLRFWVFRPDFFLRRVT